MLQNFLFKSPKEDSALKATDFGLSDYIRPGTAIVMLLSLKIIFALRLLEFSIYVCVLYLLDHSSFQPSGKAY